MKWQGNGKFQFFCTIECNSTSYLNTERLSYQHLNALTLPSSGLLLNLSIYLFYSVVSPPVVPSSMLIPELLLAYNLSYIVPGLFALGRKGKFV